MTQITEPSVAIRTLVTENSIAPTNAQALIETFQPFFAKADDLCAKASLVVVTDATQVTEIKTSRALRLQLKALRVEAEKSRKTLKEDSLRMGKAIDGIANVLKLQIEPVEQHLEYQEQFAERAEAARKEALRQSRTILLAPFVPDTAVYPLGDMAEEVWHNLMEGSRLAHEAKVAAERKAEADRLAAEAARVEEEKRIRADNERLRLEAVAREEHARKEREEASRAMDAQRKQAEAVAKAAAETARIEREKLEAVARKEREERERLERDAKARADAEAKRLADEEKAAKKAAAAPDREKLLAFAKAIRQIDGGSVKSAEAGRILAEAEKRLDDAAQYIEKAAGEL